jgi:hypothetical protein
MAVRRRPYHITDVKGYILDRKDSILNTMPTLRVKLTVIEFCESLLEK